MAEICDIDIPSSAYTVLMDIIDTNTIKRYAFVVHRTSNTNGNFQRLLPASATDNSGDIHVEISLATFSTSDARFRLVRIGAGTTGDVDIHSYSDRVVENQKFVVMSIVCPSGTHQTAESFGIKVFGCFPSLDTANAYAKTLQEQCDAFDYFTIETQCWAKLPPQVEKIDDQNFLEGQLEALKNTVVKNRKASASVPTFLESIWMAAS